MNKQYLQWFDSLNDTILYYYDSVSTQIEYTELREDYTRFKGSKKVNKGKDVFKTEIIIELQLCEHRHGVEISRKTTIYKNDVETDSMWSVLNLRNKESILDFMHENFFVELDLIPIDGYSQNTEEDETGISYKQFV